MPKQSPAAQWVHPSSLIPWPANPRRRDEATIERVAASIREFGFAAPIVARTATREIIAGHARWQAATLLGLTQVPVRFLELSEAQSHKLALADNKLYELSEWDTNKLHSLLTDLEPADLSLVGWSDRELTKLSRQLAADIARGEPEAPTLPAEPVTQLGDTWQLGRHTLRCGDCRQVEARRYGAVITDPPYGVSVVQRGMVGADFGVAKKGKYQPIAGDHETPEVRWLVELCDVAIIWGGNYFADQLPPAGGWLVWDKREASGIVNTFADCELAWSNQTGPARIHRQLWNGMIRAGEHDTRVHPTQKPVALMRWCLEFTQGDVFDPYAGSGSTLIAAEQLGRVCHAVELSPAYCDAIAARWQGLTGEAPRRVG